MLKMNKIYNVIYKLFLIMGIVFFPMAGFSQTTQSTPDSGINTQTLLIIVMVLVLIVAILVLIVALYMINILKMVIKEDRKKAEGKAAAELEEKEEEGWLKKITRTATDAVPVEEEESIMLDHNYDGIRELDNHLPPWWKALFYITIVWGIIYMLVYHVFDVYPLMYEEYDDAVKEARIVMEERMKLAENSIDENTVTFTNAPEDIEKGKEIFLRECKACHGDQGQGLIGPNFTDTYWIHGGSINDIFKTIKYGVPEKGMISWQSKLSPANMRDVASYIYTLEGTNPPNQKAPEGTEYIRDTQTVSTDSLETDSLKSVIPLPADTGNSVNTIPAVDSINVNM